MKILNQISQWINRSFPKDLSLNIHSVINCRDIIIISEIKKNQFSPKEYDYYFIIYFASGLTVTYSTSKDYQSLYNLRELFINNIGFSYFHITWSMMSNINVIIHK